MATRRKRQRTGSRAIGYIRVSTHEQGDSGLGLDAQRTAITAECGRRTWSLGTIATEVASGKSTTKRPELAAVLDALDRGEADVLIVSKLDRLARSVLDFARVMQRAERQGWAVVALDANVDTTTAQGILMTHVLAAFAEYERRLIGDRTRAALAAKKAQGFRLGRPVLLPDDVRARVLASRAGGASLRAIADELNADAVPTAQGGKRWYASSVKSVLASLELDAA